MATKSSRSTKREPSPEPAGLGEAVEAAVSGLRRTLDELFTTMQQADDEARLTCTEAVQAAELDQRKADSEAHFALAQQLRDAEGRDDQRSRTIDLQHEFERDARERHARTQQRVAEAAETYQTSVGSAQEEYTSSLNEAYRQHVAELKDIWSSLDPSSVDSGELAQLGHLTLAAAQSIPPVEPATGASGRR